MEETKLYYDIINLFPDAVIIIQDGKIVLSNRIARNIENSLEGKEISDYLQDYYQIASKRIDLIMKEKGVGKPREYEIHLHNGSVLYFELLSSYIEYQGKPAIMTVARDVTFKRQDVNNAARIQKLLMMKKIPSSKDMLTRTVYYPAKTISGDFYFIEKLSENVLVGILGDVRGKGVTAAMHISALEILFKELVHKTSSVKVLTEILNEKVSNYFNDYYVASLLFSINFIENKVILCGAGINEFLVVNKEGQVEKKVLRGPFLGMFEHLEFDTLVLNIEDVKRMLLYTDGLEEIIDSEKFNEDLSIEVSLFELTHKISKAIEMKSIETSGLSDDSTVIGFDLFFNGVVYEYTLEGMTNYQDRVNQILHDINMPDIEFKVHLILMELITNAYKYGNKSNNELPIKIRLVVSKDSLIIEVTDMGLTHKHFDIKKIILDEDILNDNGRGLFLVEQMSDKLYMDGNSIIAEVFI